MATYAVGDIQGCLDDLLRLLDLAGFEPQNDCLWCVGDLVNRGPDSLATLRFLRDLPNKQIVLGNHDLHLLAASEGFKKLSKKDTLAPILDAPDRDELLHWLQHQPLLHHDEQLGYTMVHAGIPPIWTLEDARRYSKEVEKTLQSEQAADFFANMYGNEPERWDESLEGMTRLRVITNYLTRMRFCGEDGTLELTAKTDIGGAPDGYAPWFSFSEHKCLPNRILFGHWAALQGYTGNPHFTGLDTGCVWGGALMLLRLEDGNIFNVACDYDRAFN